MTVIARAQKDQRRRRFVAIPRMTLNTNNHKASGRLSCKLHHLSGGTRYRGVTIVAAVVVTVTLAVAALLPLGVTGEGETVQVESEGAPVQARATTWLNPPSPVTLSV